MITLWFNQGDIWLYCAYCIVLLCCIVDIVLKTMVWLWITFRPVCRFWRVNMWYYMFEMLKNENRTDWCYRMLRYLILLYVVFDTMCDCVDVSMLWCGWYVKLLWISWYIVWITLLCGYWYYVSYPQNVDKLCG